MDVERESCASAYSRECGDYVAMRGGYTALARMCACFVVCVVRRAECAGSTERRVNK
jgi:hypothetical protein